MFGTTMDKNAQFAAIEADLISAHAQGDVHLHAEIYTKFAALIEDEQDIEAALDGLADLANPPKVAVGGFGSFGAAQPAAGGAMGSDLMGMLAKAVMIAGPLIAGAKFLSSKADHDRALQTTQMTYPQLFQQNPARANALFEAVYSSAPNIGKNTILMGDLLKQLMSMPMVDMGTIARLTEISKNTSQGSQGGGNPLINGISELSKKMTDARLMGSMKTSSFPANFKAADGRATVFNWGSEAAKLAGLTDAFTGSGTNLEQANQATMMNQQQSGSSMLPLDSVLHELLMKEMELQQREQTIVQQEQQLQQAMQAVQHIGSQYQGETGVDPNTGAPAQEAMPEAAPADMPPEQPQMEEAAPSSEMPMEDAPVEGEMPAEEVPAAEGEIPAEEAPVEGEEAPVEGELPAEEAPIEGEEAPIEEELPAKEAPVEEELPVDEEPATDPAESSEAAGEPMDETSAPVEEDPAMALPPAVDMSPEAVAAGEAGLADAATPMGPSDEGTGMRPEAGVSTDPFSLGYSEGSSIPTSAEEVPAEEIPAEEAVDTEANPAAEAEPTEGAAPEATDEHDMPAIEAGESDGPNTAESIEGTPEDEMHDAANDVEEGSPEDEVADQELAAVLNAGGHVAGEGEEEDVPPAEPTAGMVEAAPSDLRAMAPATPAESAAPMPPAAPAMSPAQPTANGHEIILPLRITVKIGEVDPLIAMRRDAEMLRRVALLNLPN